MSWWIYVVRCADGSLYTGISLHVERRLHQHNHTLAGATYCRIRRPVVLVTQARLGRWMVDAAYVERAFKRLRRTAKVRIIDGDGMFYDWARRMLRRCQDERSTVRAERASGSVRTRRRRRSPR